MTKYYNPILKGFHPDPSICRVGKDYYLVTSTFEFFPGVPVYHSRNLTDWELIGSCLTRDTQLDLQDCPCSGGIYAPTIRYHQGKFYMITTNVSGKGNFIVSAQNPAGPWSEPKWIDQQGIDPSLFFDDDGKVYYCGTHDDNGRQGIVLFEIDPDTGEVRSDKTVISHGGGEKYPEAPHIYKVDGWYYLMMAEGGTEYGHTETIFRSRDIRGPYAGCPHNPILSHRKKGNSPIQATGHGDLLEDENANWWMVCLGIRPLGHPMLHNLGRETFLAPVVWKDGWPVVGRDGEIFLQMEGPLPQEGEIAPLRADFYEDFAGEKLDNRWNFVRNPERHRYQKEEGFLRLSGGENTLWDNAPTFLGVRQQEFSVEANTRLSFSHLEENGRVGMTAFYNRDYHYEAYVTCREGRYNLGFGWTVHGLRGKEEVELPENIGEASLLIRADRKEYTFCYQKSSGESILLGKAPAAGLCTEGTRMMTFTGTYLGIFAEKGTGIFYDFRITEGI